MSNTGPGNVRDLVETTRGKKRTEIELILSARFGGPERRAGHGSFLPCDAELFALLRRARELYSHAVPDGDPLKLAKRAFNMLIEVAEREQRGPKKLRTTAKSATGERCPSRAFLENDHRRARAKGGRHDLENLRAACRAHNLWFAEQTFGRDYIQKCIRLRQRRSKKRAIESPAT